MRKSSKFIVVAGALAALAVPSVASASVTYDATHDGVVTGHVDKGDVQPVLGWNDSKVQNAPVQFSTTNTTVTEQSWKCTNGETRSNVLTNVFKVAVNAESVRHQTTKRITGWNLTSIGGPLETISTNTTGDEWSDCTGAGDLDWAAGMPTEHEYSLGSDLSVNGTLLPQTPAAMPAV